MGSKDLASHARYT